MDRNAFGLFGDPGVSRRAPELLDGFAPGQRMHNRVFPSARADHQDFHRRVLNFSKMPSEGKRSVSGASGRGAMRRVAQMGELPVARAVPPQAVGVDIRCAQDILRYEGVQLTFGAVEGLLRDGIESADRRL